MTVRPARPEEYAELERRMRENGGEVITLGEAPCWVVEEDGKVLGLLPLRLWFQFEPLLVFPEVKATATRRRVCYELYKAAESWVKNRELNGTGVHRAFAVTRMFKVRGWAKKMGWLHQYRRAPLWIKHF